MAGPRLNAAFYAAPVSEFLAASNEEAYAPLAAPKGYTLAPEQLSAWHLQLPVLRAALAESVPGTNSAAEMVPGTDPWISEGRGCEVEFMTLDGETIAVSTLRADQVRQAHADEIAHARPMAS